MALSAAEKQRRYRQRRDASPNRRQQYLKKEKLKYKNDLALGKRKNVSQMSEREKRVMRKRWRKQKQELKERTKMLKNLETPPASPSHQSEHVPSTSTRSSKTITLNQEENKQKSNRESKLESAKKAKVSKCYRDLAKKNFEIKILKKKVDSLRKKIKREQNKTHTTTQEPSTPRKLTRNLMKRSKKTISHALLFHHTMLAQMRRDKKEGKRYMMSLLTGQLLRKYKLKTKALKTIGCSFRRKARNTKGSLSFRLRTHVIQFLQRDDVSRLTSGKKSTLSRNGIKKQKRLLCDTMQNLHKRYTAENQNFQISYSVFCRLRPFWIVHPTETDRQTCLCKMCENTRFLTNCLQNNNIIDTNNLSELCKRVVCSTLDKDCMYGTCQTCHDKKVVNMAIAENKKVTWNQWTSVRETRTFKTGEEKEINLIKKEVKCGSLKTAIQEFENALKPKVTKHLYNIRNQCSYYKQLKEELTDNECLIHIDYAENYVGKLHEEIQSVHFGASQPQITLHTGVFFTKDLPVGSTFCTLSDSLEHGPAAVWTHIRPVLNEIKVKYPNITICHIFSDGPVTQYKQKKNFYLLSTEIFKYGFECASWNFHEAGHGKGIPDAVGGSLKRTADTRVRCGEDVTSASKFKEVLDKSGTNVTLFVIDPKEVKLFEDQNAASFKQLKAIPNTLQLHQIKSVSPSVVLYRDVSCFCGFKDSVICKGHEFKEKTFNVEPIATAVRQKNSKPKCTKSKDVCKDHTETDTYKENEDCNINLTEEHNVNLSEEQNVIFSEERNENFWTQFLIALCQCTNYASFKEKCEGIQMTDVEGQERSILECKATVDQKAIDLCPDDIPTTRALFPTIVRADGDCLPGCGSVFVYGDDSHASEIRLRIILELVLHEEYYLNRKHFELTMSSGKIRDLRKSIAMYSEAYIPGDHLSENHIKTIYQQEVMSIAKPQKYMGMWQIFGLASVLKMKIFSCYPKRGNPNVREDLHRLITPRLNPTATNVHVAVIMWSSTRCDMVETHWVPNHFLPMLPVDKICIDAEVVESVDESRCDDVFEVLFQMQNDSTENEEAKETVNDNVEMKINQEIKVESLENENEQTEMDVEFEENRRFSLNDFEVGEFVLVKYDDSDFPGKIIKINTLRQELYVQCMQPVTENTINLYMWPRKKDCCWYQLENVLMKLPAPTPIDGEKQYKFDFSK